MSQDGPGAKETRHARVMSWVPRDLTRASISITSTPSEVGDQRQGYPLITDDETKVQVKYWSGVSTWLIRKGGLACIFWPQTPWYSATVQPPLLFIKQVIERWYFIVQWLLTDLSGQLAPLVLAEGSLCSLLLHRWWCTSPATGAVVPLGWNHHRPVIWVFIDVLVHTDSKKLF